jgi:transposase-like protein
VAQPDDVDKLLDELLQGKTPEEILGREGLLKGLTKRLVERALEGEMTTHLGYEKHAPEGRNSGNSRNGSTPKSVLTGEGELEIEVPRDRNGEFDPQLVKKGQRRLPGFDDKVIALYARGLTTREIQSHLVDIYGVEVSPTLISNVTDAVLEDVRAWQSRPLDPVYPIVYLDAIHLKLRSSGAVQNQAVYVALGVNLEGQKDLLGLWIGETEGAKFWLNVLTELRNRGVRDILIACVDGLKGFPEAIENLFPQTQVQLCIVHMVRNSLRYVSWKERKAIARDLRTIYAAPTAEAAEQALEAFAARWDKRFPSISKSWRENWQRVIPFFAYPPEIRKAIYTTNAIESINATLRKVTRKRGAFPDLLPFFGPVGMTIRLG